MKIGVKCSKCNGKMSMYYVPWCPKCDKPSFRNVITLNFVQALEHLEALGHIGIKDRVWNYYVDEIHNDSYFEMYFIPENDKDEYKSGMYEDLKLIKDTWEIKNNSILFLVSW
jgi:hypothetical protein